MHSKPFPTPASLAMEKGRLNGELGFVAVGQFEIVGEPHKNSSDRRGQGGQSLAQFSKGQVICILLRGRDRRVSK